MALGATRGQIQWLVVRQSVRLVITGSLAGLALTLTLGKVLAGLLYGVSAYDAPLLLFSIAVLAVTAVMAAWIPVQRACSIDPLQALRHE
jgi:ABC-type antimicrobial peptide transport system permease subunit